MGAVAAASRVSETPRDYAGMFTLYHDYVQGLVVRLGIPRQEAPDVTSTIFTYLLKADILSQYDPERTAVTSRGDTVRVTFRAFLSAKVALYVKGQRDRIGKLAERENLRCDAALSDGDTWYELFGGQWWDDHGDLDEQDFIDRMRTWLALQPAVEGQPELLSLFDELVREVHETGGVTRRNVCASLGVAEPVAKAMLTRLRAEIRHVNDPEQGVVVKPRFWEIGGVRCGIPEVLEAIRILEAATSIMVLQPLRKAGHPLKDAAKGWYHPFSKAERQKFPYLEIDPATHARPAGHVKLAVIHRLKRMVAEASGAARLPAEGATPGHTTAPEPEEPPTPRELLENELFRLGATAETVDRCLVLATQVAA